MKTFEEFKLDEGYAKDKKHLERFAKHKEILKFIKQIKPSIIEITSKVIIMTFHGGVDRKKMGYINALPCNYVIHEYKGKDFTSNTLTITLQRYKRVKELYPEILKKY